MSDRAGNRRVDVGEGTWVRRSDRPRGERALTCGCCCHGWSWSVRGARLAAGTQVRPVLPRSRTASR